MKKIKEAIVTKVKQKNPTTNYGKDSHKAFCERCYTFNKGCFNTGTKRKDSSCRI